jgi:membrane-bound metal-dependent hydrolase YbcI (DUF457 family)
LPVPAHFVIRSPESERHEDWNMAAFREHVTVSTLLGVGYTVALKTYGWDAGQALLAGALCGLAGMLPDLDSDSGKPVKELFGLLATVGSLFVFHRLRHTTLQPADRILAASVCYLLIRFAVGWLFTRLTVHRGMWHSLPAAFFVAELTFLAGADVMGDRDAIILGGGVFLGFLSHLVLDEIYSLQWKGVLPSFKASSGTAFKLVSPSKSATVITWSLLALVTYRSAVRLGYVDDRLPSMKQTQSAARALWGKWTTVRR